MKIIRLKIQSLRNEGWFEFYTRFKQLVETYKPDKIGIGDLFRIFIPLLVDVDLLLQNLKKSYYTEPLAEADKNRDTMFRGLAAAVGSMTYVQDTATRESAKHIEVLIDGYKKNILHGDYMEESAAIYNFLEDIESKYKADITLLGLSVWINALADAEKEFQTINKKREDESRDKPKDDIVKRRREIDSLYVNMVNVIEAKLLSKGLGGKVVVLDPQELDDEKHDGPIVWNPEVYGNITYNFVLAWNEIVRKYRDEINRRAGLREKGKEDSDSDE
ncbi:MAG: DUF6261 family protein [Tannerellaceae bacterium]|jgi:hypothetical protein|nr:DUF6261 family protein [Tannerellaceae bacterium]